MSIGVLLMGCGGGGVNEGEEFDLDSVEASVRLVSFGNDLGDPLTAAVAIPDGGGDRVPAVIVLHGSGGLFSESQSTDDSLVLAPQFEEWAALLGAQGYATVFPASFYSRGYFEWSDRPRGIDKQDRLVMRVYDAAAAIGYACDHPAIDCKRLALMGFSNGASTTLLSLHDGLSDIERMDGLPPPSRWPEIAVGIAYYPGCGFNGLLSLSADDPSDYYYPRNRLYVHHAEDDSLVDNCKDRFIQADERAGSVGQRPSLLELKVYDSVDHGFDSSPDNSRERSARDRARSFTLELLDEAL